MLVTLRVKTVSWFSGFSDARVAARGFGLKAEDVSTCCRPQSVSAALNRRTQEKPLVHRVPQ